MFSAVQNESVLPRLHRGHGPALLLLACLLAGAGCRSGDAVAPPGAYVRAKVPESLAVAPASAPTIPPLPAECAVDLERVLTWAGVDNPTIQLAREAVRAGQADQLQARALLLPTLSAGSSANVHRGNLQSARGIIRDVDRQSAYVGAGSGAVGSGTVTNPGVRLTAQLADAVFEPRVARQRVAQLQFNADAVRNQILLDVASRYLQLAAAEAQMLVLLESEREYAEVARLTTHFARTGQGRQGDADRAQSDALLLHVQTQQAEEDIAVTSAELSRLLDADPSVGLRTGAALPVLALVNDEMALEQLLAIAVRNRPELNAAAAAVQVSATRLRQERIRPLAPLVSVAFSAGGFGGGSDQVDTPFGHFNGRTDFDVLAYWSLQNCGLGNAALQRQRRAEVNIALAEQRRTLDQVRREVAEARAQIASRRREIDVAQRQIRNAARAYEEDLTRAKNLLGRPIELLNSLGLLRSARQELVRALAGYDLAQFQLFVALGQPPDLAVPPTGH